MPKARTTTWIQLISRLTEKTSDSNLSGLNLGPGVVRVFRMRSSIGKETFQRSRSDAATWLRWGAFFSLIRSLRMLTLSVFGTLTVNIRSGSSPWIKQLSERSWGAESGRMTFGCVKCGLKEETIATYQVPLQWYEDVHHDHPRYCWKVMTISGEVITWNDWNQRALVLLRVYPDGGQPSRGRDLMQRRD